MTTERWLALPALKALGYSINTTDDAQLQEAKDLLIASKDDLLAYDDTTFYSRLVSGEANARRGVGRLVQLRHRGEPGHQVHRFPRRAATSGPTRWSS